MVRSEVEEVTLILVAISIIALSMYLVIKFGSNFMINLQPIADKINHLVQEIVQ